MINLNISNESLGDPKDDVEIASEKLKNHKDDELIADKLEEDHSSNRFTKNKKLTNVHVSRANGAE